MICVERKIECSPFTLMVLHMVERINQAYDHDDVIIFYTPS